MKATPWLLPVITALAVGGWIASRRHAAATVERELTVLRERIQLAKADADSDPHRRDADEKAANAKRRTVNWKEMASSLGSGVRDGPEEIRMTIRMQRLLYDLSAEELCEELEKLAATDMDERARRQFEDMIFDALIEKDPKLALEHGGSRLMDERKSWQMASALRKWAERDPTAAAAWMDQQIASGVFASKSLDGSNPAYQQYESGLVGALLKSDLQAAIKRLAGIPEELHAGVFNSGMFNQVDQAKEGDFVTMVREAVGDSKAGGILSGYAANLVHGQDFERVDHFISVSGATPDEKESMVSEAMRRSVTIGGSAPLAPEVIDKIRSWAATQTPDLVDKQTGAMLANSMWVVGGKIENVAEIVLKYNSASGNDDTLVAFLTNGAVTSRADGQKARILELAGMIKDPVKREEVVNSINGKAGKP